LSEKGAKQKMPRIRQYHRPESIQEALQLITRPDVTTAVLAGGTNLLAQPDTEIDQVVDLQKLELNKIRTEQGKLAYGSMVRVQQIVEHSQSPPLLRQTAKYEGPNTLRNVGTIGGLVVQADWESEFFASLLVYKAVVRLLTQDGELSIPLVDLTKEKLHNGLVVNVIVETGGQGAYQRVARTKTDRPIVAAVGRQDKSGEIMLAFCGVSDRPVVVPEKEIENLNPPADFRGSSSYRRQMAIILGQRVRKQLNT
jgi:probable selenate reductase FAD-binding subunit